MKIYVSSQAQERHYLSQFIQSHAIVIIEHLSKLLVMPQHSSRNHWKEEIAAQLNHVQRLKNTKKPPSENDIIRWTYSDNIDFITDKDWVANEIENFKYDYKIAFNGDLSGVCDEFNNICKSYFRWLSERLSAERYVQNREIYEELDSLL